ncbi:hypothetical protein SAMN06295970_101479 [Noviherbaspirillum suwonense]|uniref:Uncharacterized protein n=1 Tax=Noviherbaspirillum suwonense TaxID=1224511 RepID=A0ABY1PSM9_9BURK|nr:hypothetical protein SAMN06295970_101479 [Noviherbaspirillum suwonense]
MWKSQSNFTVLAMLYTNNPAFLKQQKYFFIY